MKNPIYGSSLGIWLAFALLAFGLASKALAEEPRIGMEGWEFSPAEVTIKSGETVTFHNNDDTNHDIAFDEGIEERPTLEKPYKVRQTKEYSLTFTKPGTFNYVCKIHRDYDMKGVIIVK